MVGMVEDWRIQPTWRWRITGQEPFERMREEDRREPGDDWYDELGKSSQPSATYKGVH